MFATSTGTTNWYMFSEGMQRIFLESFSGSTFAFCEVSRNVWHVTTKASSSREFFPRVFSAIVSVFDCGYLILTECLMCECIVCHVHNDQLPLHSQSCTFGCRPSVFVLCCPSIKILETAFIGVNLQLSVTKTTSLLCGICSHIPQAPPSYTLQFPNTIVTVASFLGSHSPTLRASE